MSLSTEAPKLDQQSDQPADDRTIRRLATERSGILVSLATLDISTGLIADPTPEQQSIIDRERRRIEMKLNATEATAVMAGISLDAFAAQEDSTIGEFLGSLEEMDRRVRSPEVDE
jgi:hypothetical protein